MKDVIKKKFSGLIKVLYRLYNQLYHFRFYGKERARVFSYIYKKNHWKDSESVSGPGSTFYSTRLIRQALPEILSKYNIQLMSDIPCGDFNWMKEVDLSGIKYLGMDIVPELIKINSSKYATVHRSFLLTDLIADKLPEVDLIFCRDCFVHFSFADIQKALTNIRNSKSKYLLTTTFVQHKNYDIVTGNWRQVNLQEKPFYFPAPLQLIHEGEVAANQDKSMALWEIEDLVLSDTG